jgi:DNA-binding NtrC family response regulator
MHVKNLITTCSIMASFGLALRMQSGGDRKALIMNAAAQTSVLIVESDPVELAESIRLLQAAGYRVVSASAFDEAKQKLASDSPDLLITGVRLGPYNGLHLILRSRADHPDMAAIVTTRFPDAVLEAETRRHRAGFLLRPMGEREFLDAITRSLSQSSAGASPASSTAEPAPELLP